MYADICHKSNNEQFPTPIRENHAESVGYPVASLYRRASLYPSRSAVFVSSHSRHTPGCISPHSLRTYAPLAELLGASREVFRACQGEFPPRSQWQPAYRDSYTSASEAL